MHAVLALGIGAIGVLGLNGCRSNGEVSVSKGLPHSAASSAPDASDPPEQLAELPLTLASPAEWKAAATDELLQAQIARSEGALRLLGEIRRGGERASLATELLPHAPDAEQYLGLSCELLSADGLAEAKQRALIRVLSEILSRVPSSGERADPADYQRCAQVLKAQEAGAKGEVFDELKSALEQLRERGASL